MKNSTCIIGLLALATAAVIFLGQQSLTGLRQENQSLREQLGQMAQLRSENERLSNLVVQMSNSTMGESPANSELLRLRGEVTLLRRRLSQTSGQEQEKPALQAVPPASQFHVDEYESNALVAAVMMRDPDAITNGHFFHHTSEDGQGAWYFQGTNTAGRRILTIRYGR